jgi:hypothetical protein
MHSSENNLFFGVAWLIACESSQPSFSKKSLKCLVV